MTDIDYDKMWKEIIELSQSESSLVEGEKTLKMFMDETNMKENAARRLLSAYVKRGKLKVRTIQVGRLKLNVYSPVIDKEK